MEKDSGAPLAQLAVDGGMSNSDLCMQTQADLIGIPVVRPKMRETTALGAAIAAGLAAGVWKNLEEVQEVNTEGVTTFESLAGEEKARAMFERWSKAVQCCTGFV
jgi:glycerol kinase